MLLWYVHGNCLPSWSRDVPLGATQIELSFSRFWILAIPSNGGPRITAPTRRSIVSQDWSVTRGCSERRRRIKNIRQWPSSCVCCAVQCNSPNRLAEAQFFYVPPSLTSTPERTKKKKETQREKKEEEGEQHHNKGKKEEMNERFLRHSLQRVPCLGMPDSSWSQSHS